ncbi:MAG: TetR/AcrR family transcriptional regulator [Rhizomicrobium sp.]
MSTRKKAAGGKRPYHRGNVAEDLTAAALRLLKTEPYENLSVRRLTREIGVTPANFYNHFENLDDLLLNIAADAHLRRAFFLRKTAESSENRIEAAKLAALDFVEFAVNNPQIFRIMFTLPSRIKHAKWVEAADTAFAAFVYLVYGQDLFDPTNLARSRQQCKAGYGYFALLYGLARIVLELNFPMKSKIDMKAFVEDIVRHYVDGSASEVFKRKVGGKSDRA